MRKAAAIAILALGILAGAGGRGSAGESLLARGNAAYRDGEYERAIELFESADSKDDFLTRKFNAGVSHLRRGELEEALKRFEEVSVLGEDELRHSASYNLGYCHFQKARGIIEKAAELESPDEKVEILAEAARSLRTSSDFYRKVKPEDEDTRHNISVVKTALIAVVDEIARIEEEKRRQEEEKLLENPSELIRHLIREEKVRKALCRNLRPRPAREQRLASRRLRQSEAESRLLAEKLLHLLEKEPAEGEPEPADEEKERRKRAAEVMRGVIESQKQAEVAYLSRALDGAIEHHAAAIAGLREARLYFPLDIVVVVQEAASLQEAILQASSQIRDAALAEGEAEGGEPTAGAEGSAKQGLGDTILKALESKVLQPIARLLSPTTVDRLGQLGDEEEDVVWAGEVLAVAEIPPTPENPQPPAPGGAQAPAPPGEEEMMIDAEKAKELSAAVQREGVIVRDAAAKAREKLASALLAEAIPPQEEALAALRRIADLFPRPPESPEERLRKLIGREKKASEQAESMAGLEGEPLDAAAADLAASQRGEGSEAGEIAKELEGRAQDERAQQAAPKVRDGEEHIFASGESLERRLPREGKASIDEAVEALEEALAILTGQDQQQEQQQQQQPGQDPQQRDQQQQQPDTKEGGYELTARQARMLREEMDRKRREEEKKLFSASSSITVEKDW